MHPNWLGVLSAILTLVAFFLTYRAAIKRSPKSRCLFLIPALLLAIPGSSFAVHYAHVLPEAAWYYQFRSLPGTELLLLPLGIAGGLVASLLPRILLILPLLGVAAFSLVPHIKPFIGPISVDTWEDRWDGDICLQSTPSTCGAASTATILNYLGQRVKESDLAAEAHSYSGGTEAWYLARAVRSRGLQVEFDLDAGFTPEYGLPAVVGVRLGSVGHFIPILAQEGDNFLVGDPLRGSELLPIEELERRYQFTGFHMRISEHQESPAS